MAYPKEIMDKAFETLAERRSQARNDYQYRLQVIREKAPAVEELRRELTGTSAAIARTVLSGVDVEQKLARLRDTNLYMQQHKRELLREAGLPEDYDEMHFTCEDWQGYRLYRREHVPLPEGSSGGADAGAALPYCQYR